MHNILLNKELIAALKVGVRYGMTVTGRKLTFDEVTSVDKDGKLVNDIKSLADFKQGCCHYLVSGIHVTDDNEFEVVAFEWYPDGYSTGFYRLNDLSERAAINLIPVAATVNAAFDLLDLPWKRYTNDLMPNSLQKALMNEYKHINELAIESSDSKFVDICNEPILAHYKIPDGNDYYIIEGKPCQYEPTDMIMMAYSNGFPEENNHYGSILLSDIRGKYGMRELYTYYTVQDVVRKLFT